MEDKETDEGLQEPNQEYYSMSDAFDDLRFSYGAEEKALSTVKLIGKGLFNSGKFIAKVAPKVVQEVAKHNMKLSENMLNSKGLSDNQRERLSEIHSSSKEVYDNDKFK